MTLEHQPSSNKYTNCLSYQQQGQTLKEAMNVRWKGGCLDSSWTGNREQHPAPRWFKREQGKAFALIVTQTIRAKDLCVLKYEILSL